MSEDLIEEFFDLIKNGEITVQFDPDATVLSLEELSPTQLLREFAYFLRYKKDIAI